MEGILSPARLAVKYWAWLIFYLPYSCPLSSSSPPFLSLGSLRMRGQREEDEEAVRKEGWAEENQRMEVQSLVWTPLLPTPRSP